MDVETRIPTKQELFALSGMMVKRWSMSNVQTLEDGRQYPMTMRIEDTLRDGTYTALTFLQRLPHVGDVVSKRRNTAHTSDDNTTFHFGSLLMRQIVQR